MMLLCRASILINNIIYINVTSLWAACANSWFMLGGKGDRHSTHPSYIMSAWHSSMNTHICCHIFKCNLVITFVPKQPSLSFSSAFFA